MMKLNLLTPIKRRWLSILTALCMSVSALFCITGCMGDNVLTTPITVTDYKLNTYVRISSYSNVRKEILTDALKLCDTYEHIFSRTLASSELYKVNHKETNIISSELATLINIGLEYSEISNGAFDITIGSVSSIWDFTSETPRVPDDNKIKQALSFVDYTKVHLTENSDGTYTIDMPEGTCLDLGAIAKGYIADRIKDYLLEHNVSRGIINLGGNVLCIGQKKNDTDFGIGVKQPFAQDGSSLMETLSINDSSVVSSGTYERYFYEDDKFYHHILNPSTGYPYDNELWDVTILSSDSTTGDCLSTVCFVLGLDKGMNLIESYEGVEAIFMTSDNTKHYSSGADKYLSRQ